MQAMILPATQAASERTATWRTVIAVIALYGFVLHAVLGGLAPPSSIVDHAVLCLGLGADDGAGAATAGTPEPAQHAHSPCCTVPALGLDALIPDPVTHAVAWPPRTAIGIDWTSGDAVSIRGPPGTIAHPRGPPTV